MKIHSLGACRTCRILRHVAAKFSDLWAPLGVCKIILGFFLLSISAWGQQNVSAPLKYALVIGNGNYSNITRLNNPVNDANDMTDTLQSLGFTVEKVLNGNLDQMENAVTRLKNRLSASRNTYGFFFYAGHGVQSNGENYLLPIDANIPSESYLRQRAVSVQTMLDELNQAGNELNIVVLDACRDNPFSWRRGNARGLAFVSYQPTDSIIVYATSAGSSAADGTGRNGLFTGELLKNLKIPGIDVTEVFRLTMGDVARVSGNSQRPAVYNQFPGIAYLGQPPRPVVAVPAPPPAAVTPPVPPVVSSAPPDSTAQSSAEAAPVAAVTSPTTPSAAPVETAKAAPVTPPVVKTPAPMPERSRTEKPKSEAKDTAKLWSLGASLGSAFTAPRFIATLRGTLAPFNYSFFELGMDFGFLSNYKNSGYYSIYPYIHYAFYVPLGEKFGFYAGLGAGYMIAQYTFSEGHEFPEGKEKVNVFAGDAAVGFNLFNMIDVSWAIRSNFKSVNNKLSLGYFWRF